MLASPRYLDKEGGGVFANASGAAPGLDPNASSPTLRDFVSSRSLRRPPAPLPAHDPRERWRRAADSGLRATWLGHSTVLLEIDGQRVLTDPVWGQRASPLPFAGPKRFQPVPVAIAALPPLDAVIISHDHYDHLDRGSVVELARRQPHVRFYTSLGVGAHLEGWGVDPARIVELDWWERVEIPRADGRSHLELHAAPSQHFSGRSLRDRNHTLWSSFVIRGPTRSVFFSGDTGLTPEYAEIAARLGPFDLVMLEVGAFHPSWGHIHLGPDNALEALRLLGDPCFLPVHWGTFSLALHAWDQPAERLLELAPARGIALLMPELGAPVEPARFDGLTKPWWRRLGEAVEPEPEREREPDTGGRLIVPID
ncbi:MBL fold metallo-hydrolase [Pseudenhygromyxa sp. WMMC2535]|uniref:MBL fold metallo-hydrolase n=1 Tax=Pseudenhygromyxa sp. WMMC2535 TaxID=2712867 RepID=UPI0031F95869